ncbi:hypothetical protein UMZ34_15995 [Halopseudomonas pachastrellae]|nr:hypothetical protein UMZ34_15995 [Halopseudomonas pachastrellae]
MSEDLTLRLHTDLGFGRGLGGTDQMPFYEHYYMPVVSARYAASRTAPWARRVRLTPPTRIRTRCPSAVTSRSPVALKWYSLRLS